MGEHLVDGALHADGAEREDAEYDEAEVTDAGIGDKFFEIGLNESDECAVNNADDGEDGDVRRSFARRGREEGQAEAHHTVRAHFEEHAGEDDGARGWRFDVGVRQPCVQREEGHFDGEGEEEGEEKQKFGGADDTWRSGAKKPGICLQSLLDERKVEAAGEVVQPDDADEHEDGAGHRIEDEFYGGVDAAAMTPDADEEGHGDQHDFPEEEEEEEIEREEDADDADFEHQQHDEKFLDALVNAVPGRDDGDGGEESGQDDEEDAEAVDAEVIVDGRCGDPMEIFLELVAGEAEIHFAQEQQ